MSWLFVPGLAGLSSGSNLLASMLALSVTWRGKHTSQVSWLRRLKRIAWIRHLSGLTLPRSIADAGVEWWIASLPDFPVSHTPSPESNSAPKTNGTHGPTSFGSFAMFDRPSSSWKTSQLSLLGSDEYSDRWPFSGSMRNGACLARPRSGHLISASELSSLLPTPSASTYGTSQNGERPDGTIFKQAGKPSLDTMARKGLLPTPRVNNRGYQSRREGDFRPGLEMMAQGGQLPIPTAQNCKGSNARAEQCLPDTPGQTTRCLNPQFVEWMMGWPINHTKLCKCEPVFVIELTDSERQETELSPNRLLTPGENYGDGEHDHQD